MDLMEGTGTATAAPEAEVTAASSGDKNVQIKAGEEGTQEVQAVEADSSELNEAATKVQATYRGHRTRKDLKSKAGEEGPQEVEAVEDDSSVMHEAATKVEPLKVPQPPTGSKPSTPPPRPLSASPQTLSSKPEAAPPPAPTAVEVAPSTVVKSLPVRQYMDQV